MPGNAYDTVFEIALDQHGYFTASQAREHGVAKNTLSMMAGRGNVEHVSWGLYCISSLPPSEYSQYMEAVLWPGKRIGVVSHESALSLYGLSDVNPARIHITLPTGHRTHRDIPGHLRLHHADLGRDEVRRVEGVPVTTPERTIRDCHAVNLGARLLRQAIEEAHLEGYLTPEDANALRDELLP